MGGHEADAPQALYLLHLPQKLGEGDGLLQIFSVGIHVLAQEHHLHLPLQSGSTRILQQMNRRYTKEQYLELAERIRREIPDIAITTDIIVGFPGETPEDLEETLDVVRRVKYDNAFTFIYSKRTGTPAAAMENQVPPEQVKEGFDRRSEERRVGKEC